MVDVVKMEHSRHSSQKALCHAFGLLTELSFQQSLSIFIYNRRHTWNGESTKKKKTDHTFQKGIVLKNEQRKSEW